MGVWLQMLRGDTRWKILLLLPASAKTLKPFYQCRGALLKRGGHEDMIIIRGTRGEMRLSCFSSDGIEVSLVAPSSGKNQRIVEAIPFTNQLTRTSPPSNDC